MVYFEVFVVVVWFVAVWTWRNYKALVWNLPMVGMLPILLINVGRIHDICTNILSKTKAMTFQFKGPWFTNMEILVTVDPANVHHIMSGNFFNFPKGPMFKKMFDVLGDGIFNSDSDAWRQQRKVVRALIVHPRFLRLLANVSRDKVENGLIPVLERTCRNNQVIDLQDVFQRLTFDTTCSLVTGYDPGCLSVNLPNVPFSKAMDDAEEAIFMRHVVPEKIWKLKRWLQIGSERKLSDAWKILDNVIKKYISMKRKEICGLGGTTSKIKIDCEKEYGTDLLTSYINGEDDKDTKCDDEKFLRDTILNLMIAGRDTTSSALTWFIWLVSIHPTVENKIRDELKSILSTDQKDKKYCQVFTVEESNKLIYLHGAICEALRLYPPVPFQHKQPLQADVLPTGHYVHPKVKVIFSLYAMGRMKSIWGKDCFEFKPERWISERGTIKHEPAYKFLAFNAGPRTCLGKEVAFTQMKVVAATVIHNYQVRVDEGHIVSPNCSIILYMRDGLKVRISKRVA